MWKNKCTQTIEGIVIGILFLGDCNLLILIKKKKKSPSFDLAAPSLGTYLIDISACTCRELC